MRAWMLWLLVGGAGAPGWAREPLSPEAVESARASRDVATLARGPYDLSALRSVAGALGETGRPEALEALKILAGVGYPEVRWVALRGLGHVEGGAEVLRRRLAIEDVPDLRGQAWRALGWVGGEEDLAGFAAALSGPRAEAVGAANGLAALGARGVDTQAVWTTLWAALRTPDPEVKAAVAHALYQARGRSLPDAVRRGLLQARARSARGEVRAWLLGTVWASLSPGKQAAIAVEVLRDGSREERWVVSDPLGVRHRHPEWMEVIRDVDWGARPDPWQEPGCPQGPPGVDDSDVARWRWWRGWLRCSDEVRATWAPLVRAWASEGPFGLQQGARGWLAGSDEQADWAVPSAPDGSPWTGGPVLARVETTRGVVTLVLDGARAPRGVSRWVELAREGWWDGQPWVGHGQGVRVGPTRAHTSAGLVPSEIEDVAWSAGAVVWEEESQGVAVPTWSVLRMAEPLFRGRRTWLGQVQEGLDILRAIGPDDRIVRVEVIEPAGAGAEHE